MSAIRETGLFRHHVSEIRWRISRQEKELSERHRHRRVLQSRQLLIHEAGLARSDAGQSNLEGIAEIALYLAAGMIHDRAAGAENETVAGALGPAGGVEKVRLQQAGAVALLEVVLTMGKEAQVANENPDVGNHRGQRLRTFAAVAMDADMLPVKSEAQCTHVSLWAAQRPVLKPGIKARRLTCASNDSLQPTRPRV